MADGFRPRCCLLWRPPGRYRGDQCVGLERIGHPDTSLGDISARRMDSMTPSRRNFAAQASPWGAAVSMRRRRYGEFCRGLHQRHDAPNTSAGIPIIDCQRGGARRDRRLLGATSIASPATNAVGARMHRWSTAHRCRNFHGARKCTFFRQMHHCRAIHRGINHFCFSKAKCRKRSL